jgi:hypothetical protein
MNTIQFVFFLLIKEEATVASISVNSSPYGLGYANHSTSPAHIQKLARDCILSYMKEFILCVYKVLDTMYTSKQEKMDIFRLE